MSSEDFAYWLKGLFDVSNPKELNANQVDLIQRHMALVFKYEIDPSYSDDPKVQAELQNIHDGIGNLENDMTVKC